ncbi:hypothetical protein [Arthrobacter sp. PAMC25284]|uniref:hypothetical protein n=1 Tax=Arthrobacter sp. PAMC25284 TaxID=2861279 RepID=UPI00280B530E|nr:hypothetical protein [Arthrobacter sp. PAMC25284]
MSRPPLNPSDSPENSNEDSAASTGDGQAGPGNGGAGDQPVRPGGIVVIAAIVALEAAALLLAAGWYGWQLVTGAPVLSFWGAVFTLALLLALSTWLFAVARFLLRGYRWPRAGALVAQLLVLTIGFPTATGGYAAAGAAMLVPAAAAIVLLFDKRVVAYTSRVGDAPPAL